MIGSIFILIGIIAVILAVRSGDDGAIGLISIITIILWLIGIWVIGAQINDIILCGTLPEKILLNYIQTH